MRLKVAITGYIDVPECWQDYPAYRAAFYYIENDDLENAITTLCAEMREQYEDEIKIEFEEASDA